MCDAFLFSIHLIEHKHYWQYSLLYICWKSGMKHCREILSSLQKLGTKYNICFMFHFVSILENLWKDKIICSGKIVLIQTACFCLKQPIFFFQTENACILVGVGVGEGFSYLLNYLGFSIESCTSLLWNLKSGF